MSWSGSEKVGRGDVVLEQPQDIVLDPSKFLLNRGRGSTEIGLAPIFVLSLDRQLVRLNRCFVVHRSGSARERYAHSIRTASYIRAVVQSGTPVWLAHREGRAKDGRDTTAPALMRTLSDGCAPEVECPAQRQLHQLRMGSLRCVEVHELLSKDAHGAYVKSDGEDELSMWLGLSGPKGRVHLEFGYPLEWRAHTDERSQNGAWRFCLMSNCTRGCGIGPTSDWLRNLWVCRTLTMPTLMHRRPRSNGHGRSGKMRLNRS